MSDSRRHVERLVADIDDFLAGRIDLDDVQARLQSTMTLLDRGSAEEEAVGDVESEIEYVRFTVSESDRLPRARSLLGDLRRALVADDTPPVRD